MTEESTGTKQTENTPMIYVASLADYNAGRLHGCWIDADQTAEAIREQIAKMLAESKEPIAEEYAIHDYQGFGDLTLSESESIEQVAEVANGIVQYGPVFGSLVAYIGDAEDAHRYMEEGYRGEFESLADYAQELVEDCYADVLKNLPDFIRYHVDYDGIANDMELSGDVFTFTAGVGRTVHVFDAHI